MAAAARKHASWENGPGLEEIRTRMATAEARAQLASPDVSPWGASRCGPSWGSTCSGSSVPRGPHHRAAVLRHGPRDPACLLPQADLRLRRLVGASLGIAILSVAV